MRLFIAALLVAISYAQTAEEAAEATTGVSAGAAEDSTVEVENVETGTEAVEAEAEPEAPVETETGSTGTTTGEIPSLPSLPSAGAGGFTGTMPLPCKMRMMNNCEGPSPMGGRCYLSEFTECEEAEAGDGDYMCVGLGMTACNAKRQFCFWDMSDMECTSNKEMEIPMLPGMLPGLPGMIPGLPIPGSPQVPDTGASAAATSPQNPMAAIMGPCVGYTLTNLAACTMANGCYLDEEQCKPIAAKMAGIDPPEIEAPEGLMPGMGMLPGLPGMSGAPLSKAQAPQEKQAQPAQDTSSKNPIPTELIYGAAGFFGGILISVIIYFLTFGLPKRNSHSDVFLEEYSSREFPVV